MGGGRSSREAVASYRRSDGRHVRRGRGGRDHRRYVEAADCGHRRSLDNDNGNFLNHHDNDGTPDYDYPAATNDGCAGGDHDSDNDQRGAAPVCAGRGGLSGPRCLCHLVTLFSLLFRDVVLNDFSERMVVD